MTTRPVGDAVFDAARKAVRAQESTSADLLDRFRRVRALTDALAAPLSAEDACVQSMPDCSPAKWHLAHMTWFFERLVLRDHELGFTPFDERFDFLFNSYYNALGKRQPRPRRGMITRPSLAHVKAYRRNVDERMAALLGERFGDVAIAELVEIGIQHEQQHQELLLMDITHLLAQNPFGEAYLPEDSAGMKTEVREPTPLRYVEQPVGTFCIGVDPGETPFCYDNETPRHASMLHPHAIANRTITNVEFAAFISDGGYSTASLWLDDGLTWVCENDINMPLYWREGDGPLGYERFTLRGWLPVEPNEPVCHVSFYEADAYARWCSKRLPMEFEWERACRETPSEGALLEDEIASSALAPRAHTVDKDNEAAESSVDDLLGNVWEWTASPYVPYPGFRPLAGALGEYNAKFMCNQFVLRGGSSLTPRSHIRPTYRNFFHPDRRWACTGIRLAQDA